MTSDDLGLAQPPAQAAEGDVWAILEGVAKGQMLEGFRQKLGRVVAGIIWDEHWDDLDEHAKGDAMRAAEATLITFYDYALSAEAAGTIAAARKPEEPTQEMIQAGLEAHQTENVKDASLNGKVARIYGAMVSAAPEAS